MPPAPELPRTRSAPVPTPSARLHALERQKSRVLDALRAGGTPPRVVHAYRPFGLLALELTADHIAKLQGMSDVLRVWPDVELDPQLASSLPYTQAPDFQQTYAGGAGTSVAIIDTPVRMNNAAFGSCPSPGAAGCSVRLELNFASNTIEEVIAREDQAGIGSHGTNVAAIVVGVAPQTDILSLNVFHNDPATGSVIANLSDTLAAMAWVAENAATYGIVAINTSLGTYRSNSGPCNDAASFNPIRTLHRDHGVLTVTVSGNDGLQNAVRDPGCVSSAVTVGAVFDHDAASYSDVVCSQGQPHAGQLACFSNLNGLVDLMAPGVDVSAGGFTMTGTSQAAPHVTGAIAAWQSWYLAQDGAFRSAAWMQRNLIASSASPLIHKDARSFSQLRMMQGVDWTYAHAFGWWYEELPENVIPVSAPGLQEQLTIFGQNGNVGGAYLYLEIVHPRPEDVKVTLTSPSGKTASLELPYGQANFTGILGRTVFPGALSALAGSPANGTWTLSLRDTQGADVGHYLQAALYLTEQGCQPQCEAEGCGDDRCGDQCGAVCIIDGACRLDGDRADTDPCQGCRPASDYAAWTTLDGDPCDDGNACTSGDTCHVGQCEGTSVAGCGGTSGSGGTSGGSGASGASGTSGSSGGFGTSGSGPADEVPTATPDSAPSAEADGGGCGCRSASTSKGSGATALWLAALAMALGITRRRP
jgi:MYXO-CTERM domain-containing protein